MYKVKDIQKAPKSSGLWVLSLFKGRFVKFMGGFQSMSESKQESIPLDSRVNVVVPSLSTLREKFDSQGQCLVDDND